MSLAPSSVEIRSETLALELWREYVQWLLSRKLRQSLAKSLEHFGLSPEAATTFLENLVMRQLLDDDFDPTGPHLTSPDPDIIESALLAIRRTDLDSDSIQNLIVDSGRDLASEQVALLRSTPFPNVYSNDAQLSIGQFSLAWSEPLERAFRTVRKSHDRTCSLFYLLRSALRYDSIFARTRHIGPPQAVYDAFHEWGVRNEGFASPFNARLIDRPDSRFFSVFPDTDAPFGSQGSFFDADLDQYDGAWCLDPPFLPETLDRVDRIIAAMRAARPERGVILIVPESHQVATPPDETVILEAGVHWVEGLGQTFFALPVNVTIHRYGPVPGFSADIIRRGYSRPA